MGQSPSFDCLVTPQADGSIVTAVYRKPTHTDMYLHWDSYHHLAAKYSVINTLRHRAKTVCTTKTVIGKKKKTISSQPSEDANILCGPGIEQTYKEKEDKPRGQQQQQIIHCGTLHERIGRIMQKHLQKIWCRSLLQGGRTIRDILVHPKDKDTILKKSGVIYKYSCGRVDCGEEYIGESGRTFGERYREHMRSPSPIMDHHNTQAMKSPWKTLLLWVGKTTHCQEHQRSHIHKSE